MAKKGADPVSAAKGTLRAQRPARRFQFPPTHALSNMLQPSRQDEHTQSYWIIYIICKCQPLDLQNGNGVNCMDDEITCFTTNDVESTTIVFCFQSIEEKGLIH